MSMVPDPRRSRAVLIGTARYDSLPALTSVEDNLLSLAEALTASETWGLPSEHVTVVPDPATSTDMLDPIVHAADEATDTMVLYYAGHGLIDPRRGELHLALVGSDSQRIYTAVSYAHIRDALLGSRATRRIVILDCCYSGRALGTMADPITAAVDEASTEGTYVLAATAENQKALAPVGEPHTAFTAELLRVFQDGIHGHGALLDLDTIYNHVRAVMRGKGRPLPQKRDRNTAGQLTLIRNRAYVSPREPAPAAPVLRATRPPNTTSARSRTNPSVSPTTEARSEEPGYMPIDPPKPKALMSSQLVYERGFDSSYHTGGLRAAQGKCSWHGKTCDENVVASVVVRHRGGETWHAVCQRALDTLRAGQAAEASIRSANADA
ncbi:caspase family protein [Streptosporangium sp. 'caverna']|uniref:caspase family protein n=1 Tax=Streptosporangium sp. 'caverna' TaxID=2202249 RepID=UPI000D7DD79E|nr:caspase family protein [Streptosporangium sp. 'caverna']AWS45159.1 peptidase C14 [Streptosporangium sp. 'caverna']